MLRSGLVFKLLLVCSCFTGFGAGGALAQNATFKTIAQDFDQYRKKALQEKIFLHLDRPVYTCGETMWFKMYAVDGTVHNPLAISRIGYVEVLDEAQKPVLQGKIALNEGSGNGSFILPATLGSGNYTVRAYTTWMRNFGPEFYFEQPVTIVNTFQTPAMSSTPTLPAYAIQFFPEGGNIVAGVSNKVAFKTTDKRTGKGIAYKGEIRDAKGKKIADIAPYRFGIGHVTFTPEAGMAYTAIVTLPNGQKFEQPLPKVYDQGNALNLQEEVNNQLKITVSQTGQQAAQLYLLGHTRQMIAVSETATINQGAATFLVDKNALADGITHFTVFNADKKPVSERLYFKQPTQLLHLNLATDKQHYTTREKVALDITAQAGPENNTAANLSMAVYRLDSLQATVANSIESYLWLTSDLKGTIENPGYYFSAAGATDSQAIDNLMLTHGWSRFKWEDILDKTPATYSFAPEFGGHWITGQVTSKSTGAPAPGIMTYLASPSKHIRLYSSQSDTNGLIRYEVKDYFGQKEIVVQSDFTKDSTYHFKLFSPFSDKFAARQLPAFKLSDKLYQDLTLRHVQSQVQQAYFGQYTNRFAAAGIDSISFYGHATEQYYLDDYKRFKVMEEVMREYVPGVVVRLRKRNFYFMVVNRPYKTIFEEQPLVLLDGVPVFNVNKIMAFNPLKVNKLEVIASRFFTGQQLYEGVVSYTTYKGDLGGFELDPRALMQEYEGLQLQREFYAPAYDTDTQKQSRLADLRNLLHWAPDLKVKTGTTATSSFYTSDQPGTYLVFIQGLTASGQAGSKVLTFKVGQPL
ncbi:hypothetical protein [Pontibacter fetidus]|uniref:MG2 domain-containing protein n=1 Tax=Pontibacter fetidus TaxID=2700082 RepID=A0A6B2H778_9BACT|nr:hypothetical protein [Pontibacter fetidus]NDK56756.1 hypothetical protein [Pontibacter fetidus]